MLIRILLPLLFFTSLPFISFAQLNIDSLKASLAEAPLDSNRVKTLNKLAWNLRSIDPKRAMSYASEAVKLAQEIHFDKGRSEAYNAIGVIHYRRGEYVEATKAHLQALTIREMIGDRTGMASSHINLGNIYSDQLNNKAAIDNYLMAAKILENTNDINRLTFVYLNIGAVFLSEDKFDEALPYCEKARAGAVKAKNQTSEAQALNNLGVVREGQQRYDDALAAYKASFEISKSLGDKVEMTDNMINIGNMYRRKNDVASAMDWHQRAEIVAREITYLEGLRVLYRDYAKDYEASGDYKTALNFHKRYKNLSDSLFNDENSTKINSLMDKWESDRNEKELLVKQQKLFSKQETDRLADQRLWVIASGGIVLLLFGGYVLYASSRIKRARILIDAQTEELYQFKNRHRDTEAQ
jgi:tetratricopeptide (TPR) repeat protein